MEIKLFNQLPFHVQELQIDKFKRRMTEYLINGIGNLQNHRQIKNEVDLMKIKKK